MVGVGYLGRGYVTAAERLGLTVRAVEPAERAARLGFLDRVHIHHPGGDLEEHWAEAAQALAARHAPDGVLAFSEPQVLAAALLQEARGLPGPSLHAATVSRNKALQRGLFRNHGIPQPDYLITNISVADEEQVAPMLPVVLKPLSGTGSAGVERVLDMDEFRAASRRRDGELLMVETEVEGQEYSWEAIIQGGSVWLGNLTRKETSGPPYYIETLHRPCAELPGEVETWVAQFVHDVTGALRFDTGLIHLEFRLTGDGPCLMEVAVRTPGDSLMDLLTEAYGVDWYEMTVRAAMGMELPEPPPSPIRHTASYFTLTPPGVVIETGGQDKVLAHPCVIEGGISVNVGDTVPVIRSSIQRTGYSVLAADTGKELEEALEFARGTLLIRTGPAERDGHGTAAE